MKKLFSIVLIALMSIVTLNAETTRIYCKMAQDWWKADGAAVGCHSWGNPGPGTDWPGVRMTPVEGETDLWYIDLDVTKVQNVIFTRVNPSGAIADWGAKTKDLVIPVNGDNLFTITTSDESWGDPGCDGEWSVYGDTPTPPTPGTNTYYLVGYINGASSGCDEDYENLHEEYKFVDGKLTTTFTETSYVFVKTSDNEHWYLPDSYIVPAAKVEVILAENNAERVGVNGNVEVTFTLTENADGTVTLSYQEAPTPADEGFGIILGDGTTIKGQKNEGQIEFLEYVTEANLTAGAVFQLYDFANEVAWTVDNIDEASTPNLAINEDYVYEVTADGKYTIYLKMYGMGDDQVYIAYEAPTGLFETMANANVKKVMVDGIFYIVKDNKAYTVLGF